MREWLSGGAPPCQGGGRGFDPRLALLKQKRTSDGCSFFVSRHIRASKFDLLRFAPVRAGRGPPDLVRRLALFLMYAKALILQGFSHFYFCEKMKTLVSSF